MVHVAQEGPIMSMRVYLLKDVTKVGVKGEIVKVKEGFADNFLFPRKLAVAITKKNEDYYKVRETSVEHRKEVIDSKTSMLAERIKALKVILKRKLHDDGKLYGSINPAEIAEALGEKGVSVSKSQVLIEKSIKAKGAYEVTIKLSSKLKPMVKVEVVAE